MTQAQVDAPSAITLQSLRERNPKAFTSKVCVLPPKAPAGTRFIAADDRMGTIVSDVDRDAFERFLPFASRIFQFDPFARMSSAKLYPISMQLSCPETFEVLRAPEDVDDGESRLMTVVRISTDVHRELSSMVEQTCKTAALEGTDRLYVGQQIGTMRPIVLGRTNAQFDARIRDILGIERIPEPQPSGPRSLSRQLMDTTEGQALGGFGRGGATAVIPGGTLVKDLAIEAGLLSEGTRTSRIVEACVELGVGVAQIAVGCTGIVAGTGMTGTGGGAPVGVPVLVGSLVLTTAGTVNVCNRIRHLTIELWRSDDSDAAVSSSPPPSEAKPAAPAPQTAKPAPAPTPAAKAGAPAPGSGQTTLRNAHLAGKKHPKTGVPFDKDGYPDFRAAGMVKKEVKIKFSGARKIDDSLANKEAKLPATPEHHTWHHHQDGTTMQLVPTNIHQGTGHTGGFVITKKRGQ